MLVAIVLGACALIAAWVNWRIRHKKMLEMAEMFPGPPTIPGLGNALMFMVEPEAMVRLLRKMVIDYGDVVRFWLGLDLNVIVSDPDELKMLLASSKNSVKGPLYKYIVPICGQGILTGSGPVWRKHRKLATPNYGKLAIESYSDTFNREADLLVDKFKSMTGKELDVYNYVVQTTTYAVCQTLMGLDKQQTMNLPWLQDIIDDTAWMLDVVFDRMAKWYLQIDLVFWMTHNYHKLKKFLKKTEVMSKAILNHRIDRVNTLDQKKLNLMKVDENSIFNAKLSVIDRFLLSNELDAKELIDETFTTFTTSQETSAKVASFLLLMMAFHPECQEILYAEIQSVIGKEDRPVTSDDISRMRYLDMTFKEVLRLFPIGAILQRTITEDTKVGKRTIPAGTSLVAPLYYMQRDPRFWECPDAFDPERFSPDNSAKLTPNCYLPFSTGPMDCMGRHFGEKLVKTICIKVLQNFNVTSSQSYKDLRLAFGISVVSLGGFPVTLTPRYPKKHFVENYNNMEECLSTIHQPSIK